MRDFKTTRFTKKVRITVECDKYLMRVKGKKSKAGKLEEIIKDYDRQNSVLDESSARTSAEA